MLTLVSCSVFLQVQIKPWWHWPELAWVRYHCTHIHKHARTHARRHTYTQAHELTFAKCWGYPLLVGVLYLALRQGYYNDANACFIADYWPPGSRHFLIRPWCDTLRFDRLV